MSLSFQTRRVGEVTVVSCRGRIIAGEEGGETAALERQLDALLSVNRLVLLHLGEVEFIDSAGFGVLVRYVTRPNNVARAVRICAVSPAIDHILQVTRLKGVLQPYDSEAEAIEDAHRPVREAAVGRPNVLCVDESEDVLAYLREMLREHGHRVVTATNLRDARILLTAIHPQVVVLGASVRAGIVDGTYSAGEFQRLTTTSTVVELPAGFPREEAAAAAERVLEAIRAASISGATPSS